MLRLEVAAQHPRGDALGGLHMTDNKWLRNGFVWIVLIIAVIALWFTFMNGSSGSRSVSLKEVASAVNQGRVSRLDLTENSNEVTVHYRNSDDTDTTRLPDNVDI